MSLETYYTIYRTTNTINNKIYIGKHQTEDLEDGYLGSGKILKRAINLYGEDKFESEILYIFESKIEMDKMEAEIVDAEFVKREDTYNIKLGGEGGFDHINYVDIVGRKEKNRKAGRASAKKNWANPEFVKMIKEKASNTFKRLHKEGLLNSSRFKDKKHTEETKKKMSGKTHQKGSGNSNYGKCWIYNKELKESKSVKKENLEFWLNKGWIRGRKIKF